MVKRTLIGIGALVLLAVAVRETPSLIRELKIEKMM
jgi:hypothetical protein